MAKLSKSERIRKYLEDHPHATSKEVSTKLKVPIQLVYCVKSAIKKKDAIANGHTRRRSKHPDDREPKVATNGHSSQELLKDIETINRIGIDRVRRIVELVTS